MNIADAIADHAQTRPTHPAIEDGKRIVSYAQLDELVTNCATNLHEAGVRAGDIVGVMLPDSADHLVVLCALARVGGVIFSLNGSLPKTEIGQNLSGFDVKAVIAERSPPTAATRPPILTIEDVGRPASNSFDKVNLDADHPLVVVQSSGTTGSPKSFLRSHTEMREVILRYAYAQGWTLAERSLSLNHMYFNIGFNVCVGMLQVGATVVVNRARSSDELVSLVREKQITYVKLTPAHLRQLLNYATKDITLFPKVRAMVVGSAPMTHNERLLARKRLTPNLFEQLGANEAGLLVLASPSDQDAYPDSVGRIVDGVEAEIVDAHDRILPAEQIGIVRYRGAGIATSYQNNPEATARAFRNGWFYPGDLAALNDEGYLFFKGRADDVINNEGAKFYPREVENVLLEHPAITEAAVFGWPHKRFGEVAVAFVVTGSRVTKREITAFCRQRLAGYKVPPAIVTVPEMPRNRMGKIVKRKLKEQFGKKIASRNRFLSRA